VGSERRYNVKCSTMYTCMAGEEAVHVAVPQAEAICNETKRAGRRR
jgi:hypothetical protein